MPHTLRGAAIGGLSGFLGAGSQLFQRLGTVDTDPAMGLHAFANHVFGDPITLVWIGLSLISMVVMQFSYRRSQQ